MEAMEKQDNDLKLQVDTIEREAKAATTSAAQALPAQGIAGDVVQVQAFQHETPARIIMNVYQKLIRPRLEPRVDTSSWDVRSTLFPRSSTSGARRRFQAREVVAGLRRDVLRELAEGPRPEGPQPPPDANDSKFPELFDYGCKDDSNVAVGLLAQRKHRDRQLPRPQDDA